MLIYRTALEIHNAAADPETSHSKFAVDCIRIEPDGVVTATDGHEMLRMWGKAVDEDDLLSAQTARDNTGEITDAVLIPADVAKAFLAASKRKKVKGRKPPSTDQVVIGVQDGAVTLATVDGKTKRRFLIEEDDDAPAFPNLGRVIARGRKPALSFTADVEMLLKLLTTLKRCGVETVECLCYGPHVPIRVLASTQIDGTRPALDGLFMPSTLEVNAAALETADRAADESAAESIVGRLMDNVDKAKRGDPDASPEARRFVRKVGQHGGVTIQSGGRSVSVGDTAETSSQA